MKGYIAKSKLYLGTCFFQFKPIRDLEYEAWQRPNAIGAIFFLNDDDFPEISWDHEPVPCKINTKTKKITL